MGEFFAVTDNTGAAGFDNIGHNTGTNDGHAENATKVFGKKYGPDAAVYKYGETIYDLKTGADGEPALFITYNAVASELVSGIENMQILYGVDNGRQLEADIFTPMVIPEDPRPAIVFLHGGSWMFGSPSQFHTHAAYLAEKYDFFAMSVDYRMSYEARFPAALQDAKCAVRWVRSRAKDLNIDPDRIVICIALFE